MSFLAALGAAAQIGGQIADIAGQYSAKKEAEWQFRRTLAFNSEEAVKNRDFQQQMWEKNVSLENTAYQRAMADMDKAGLPRMMMWSKGGPSDSMGALGGGQASASPGQVVVPRYGQSVSGAMSTALQLQNMAAQTKLIDAQADKTIAETKESLGRTGMQDAETKLMRMQTDNAYATKLLTDIKSLTEISNAKQAEIMVYRLQAELDLFRKEAKLKGKDASFKTDSYVLDKALEYAKTVLGLWTDAKK